jgi:uncharacterized protein
LSLLRTFFWSLLVTVVGLAAAWLLGGLRVFIIVAILSILEISFSFDNAVINATVLRRMSKFWQTIFLTVGILIAVFGMRLVFPFLLVSASAAISPWEAIQLAVGSQSEQQRFADLLVAAHPTIAAFGGVFLLMIFLDFIFEERDYVWMQWLERPLAKIGKLDQLSVLIALGVIALAAEFLAPEAERARILLAGVLGLFTYLLVNGLSELFTVDTDEEEDEEEEPVRAAIAEAELVKEAKLAQVPAFDGPSTARANARVAVVTGKAAFFLFLYLEVLDASFSFDGVVGAFAITLDPFVIALGLGIGAMYVRSVTVYLVNRGTLDNYVYLEHGAHWAIGALAVILIISMKVHLPEVVTGLIGVAFIAAALWSSVRRNRKVAAGELDADSDHKQLAKV